MISKVHRPHESGARNKQPKSTFLGRQWEAGGFNLGIYKTDAFFSWPRFFTVLGITWATTPGFTPLQISQDLLLIYKPNVLFPRFHP